MSDDDSTTKDNIIKFPNDLLTRVIPVSAVNHFTHVENRKAVLQCMETLMEKIENNYDITGIVCLSFNQNGAMEDCMAGDINAANLYVMLDKVKMEVMSIVCEAMESDEPLMED
jgi:hypothetical protein